MTTMCADQRQSPQLHHLLSGKKALRDIDIPPRRLLGRRPRLSTSPDDNNSDVFIYLPENTSAEEAMLRKFLPYNNNDDEDSDDPYSSDEFRMYEFKVRRCMRSRSHDWTDCPFAHPGEKARRRDPRRFHYSGNVCSDFRRGGCSRGDACEFAHGVFECWLHPSRYRTQACKDGKNCKRKVCFFAHTPHQLRVLPLHSQLAPQSPRPTNASNSISPVPNHCCVFCHSVASSPTSTLMGFSHLSPPSSPSLSPPRSPVKKGGGIDVSRCGYSPLSRCNDGRNLSSTMDTIMDTSVFNGFNQFLPGPGALTYKDAFTDLMNSLETMDLRSATTPTRFNSEDLSWANVSLENEDEQQFILSPSTPQAGLRETFNYKNSFINHNNGNNDDGFSCPDLEWVKELVM